MDWAVLLNLLLLSSEKQDISYWYNSQSAIQSNREIFAWLLNLEPDIFVPHAGCNVIWRKPHLKISLLYQKHQHASLSARKAVWNIQEYIFFYFLPSRRSGFFPTALCVDWQFYLGCQLHSCDFLFSPYYVFDNCISSSPEAFLSSTPCQ